MPVRIDVTHCSVVSIVEIEQINAGYERVLACAEPSQTNTDDLFAEFLTAKTCYLFSSKALSWMFDWVLNTLSTGWILTTLPVRFRTL